MKVDYFITADYVIQDKNTDKYSLFGVFDNFNIPPQNSDINATFAILAKVLGTKDTTKVEIEFINPDGTPLDKITIETDDPTPYDSLTIAALVNNLKLAQIGDYPVKIFINGHEANAAPNQYLTVSKLEE